MQNNISPNKIMSSLIPISRFNKGEANKIFEEVKESGFKIVLKNNTPTCVLITPEAYEQMLEIIEDYQLLLEAEKRMQETTPNDFVPLNDVLSELGITQKDLDDTELELD